MLLADVGLMGADEPEPYIVDYGFMVVESVAALADHQCTLLLLERVDRLTHCVGHSGHHSMA